MENSERLAVSYGSETRLLLRACTHPVNRADLSGALGRIFSHLVTCRVVAGPVPIPFVNDTWLFCDRLSDESVGLRLLVLRDFAAMSFVAHYLRPLDHFVDVGAGIGSYSVLAAGVAEARVSAFEARASAASVLARNVAVNDLGGLVQCFWMGVSDCAGWGHVGDETGQASRLVVDPCAEPAKCVDVQRLDDLLQRDPAHVVKIDVSGDELAVLRGAHATLQRPELNAVIVATEKGRIGLASRWHRVNALLEWHGFAAADYNPLERRLLKPSVLGEKCLYVRASKAEAIIQRLARAPCFWPTVEFCL